MKTKTKIKHEALKSSREREMTNEVRTLPPNLKESKYGTYMPHFINNGEEIRAKGGWWQQVKGRPGKSVSPRKLGVTRAE